MAVTFTDRQILKRAIAGLLAATGITDHIAETANLNSDVFTFLIAADGMASTTTAETYVGLYFRRACKLKAVTFLSTAAGLTADASNNATVTVNKRDNAAANPLAVATYTSNVAGGGITANVGKPMVLTGANISIAAGSVLTWTVAKGGTGVVVPAMMVHVEVEWD